MKAFKCHKCRKFFDEVAFRIFGYWNYKTDSWNKIDLCDACQEEVTALLNFKDKAYEARKKRKMMTKREERKFKEQIAQNRVFE